MHCPLLAMLHPFVAMHCPLLAMHCPLLAMHCTFLATSRQRRAMHRAFLAPRRASFGYRHPQRAMLPLFAEHRAALAAIRKELREARPVLGATPCTFSSSSG
jgi:hypothetical protein